MWTHRGEGRPVWVEDPDDDVARHVTTAHVPPATDLASWAANRAIVALDRDRPPWRADVVDGLPTGHFAVLVVVHHILADGLAGMRLLAALLDTDPDAVRDDPPAHTPPPCRLTAS